MHFSGIPHLLYLYLMWHLTRELRDTYDDDVTYVKSLLLAREKSPPECPLSQMKLLWIEKIFFVSGMLAPPRGEKGCGNSQNPQGAVWQSWMQIQLIPIFIPPTINTWEEVREGKSLIFRCACISNNQYCSLTDRPSKCFQISNPSVKMMLVCASIILEYVM